ncbi:MAG: hypothetical protein ACN6O8_08780 [Achromobacter sp.]|uniref:DUF2946 family protein n=1 Tax=Achromobacter sp. TaxID=134375 RepID=UPI003CFDDCCD
MSAVTRRALAWLAAGLLVFQSLVAATAFGAPAPMGPARGASVILCTAGGPRVVALDGVPAGTAAAAAAPAGSPGAHDAAGGTLPHCCAASCAMLGGVGPPAFAGQAWRLPPPPSSPPRAAQATPCPRGQAAWLPQQSRAPPNSLAA